MKTIPPPQKPEVKICPASTKTTCRAPSRSTYNCTASYIPTDLPNFFFRRMANSPPKTKNKNKRKHPPRSSQAPHQQAQKTQYPVSLPSLIQRYLCMSMMCVWDLPWTYVLPSKTTIRRSERRKSKSWPSQLASKKVAKKADGAKIEYIFKIHR